MEVEGRSNGVIHETPSRKLILMLTHERNVWRSGGYSRQLQRHNHPSLTYFLALKIAFSFMFLLNSYYDQGFSVFCLIVLDFNAHAHKLLLLINARVSYQVTKQ